MGMSTTKEFRVEYKVSIGFSGALTFVTREAAEAMIFALRHLPAYNRAISVKGYGWVDSRPEHPDLFPACEGGVWTEG